MLDYYGFVNKNAISIHALVKRATETKRERRVRFDISIHALVKRATRSRCQIPRHHSISIHALVKRATYKVYYIPLYKAYFNPRPREEGDCLVLSKGK